MTGEAHEPYVADPEEPARRPRLAAARPLLAAASAVLVVLAVLVLLTHDRAEQDPSLEPPDGAPAASAAR